MEPDHQEQVALHRWAVIAEATSDRLSPPSAGRSCARSPREPTRTPTGRSAATHAARSTAGSAPGAQGGLDALKPTPRADTGAVRAHPELFGEAAALRLEIPSRSAAQIASILYYRHGIKVAERTIRAQLRRRGLHREALLAEPKVFGRYEAERPNERWITDVLVGPCVPVPEDRRLGARQVVPDRRRPLPALGRRPLLRPRERPGLPGAACDGPSHAVVCPTSSMPTTGRRSPTPG